MTLSIETALVAIGALALGGLAVAQQAPSDGDLARMMQEHARAAEPGPEHERLAAMAGTWDMEVTMWPEPGAEPMAMPPVVLESEMILGGRFLRQSSASTGDFPMEMLSFLGFDRRNGVYNLMAMDTSGTYWVTASGVADEEGNLVLSGTDWDGIAGAEQVYDFVMSWEDDDTLVTRIVFKDDMHTRGGPPHTMVETRAVRRTDEGGR